MWLEYKSIQKYTKVAKGSKAIFSACYNISQPNFVILLIFSMLFLAVPVVIYLHLHVPSFKISLYWELSIETILRGY
jgi:hypothetical protein